MLLRQYNIILMYKLTFIGEQFLAIIKEAEMPFSPFSNAHFIQFDHIL